MNTLMKLVAASAVFAAVSGCAPTRILIQDSITAGRSDKTLLVPAATVEDNKQLFDYVVRLCDVDAQGTESNCKDSAVLQNVVSNSVY